jgi:transposase
VKPSPRQVLWWLLQPQKCTAAQTAFVARLEAQSAPIRVARQRVQEFCQVARERKGAALGKWTEAVEKSGLARLKKFARGLHSDWDAVVAGLSLEWSNGPVEGQVHRVKLVKRQMYGRASFELLSARVLPFPPG